MFNIQTKNQFDDLFEDVHSVKVSDVRRADDEGYDLTFSISLGAMSLFT